MKDYPDEELMRLAANDDVSAFEELFHRHNQRVLDFFHRMVWNAEEARDCTQETFLKLWRRRGQYAGKARVSTYLFQIAKNHFLDNRRKRESRIDKQCVSVDASEEPLGATSSVNGYEDIMARDIRSALSEAVARLPEKHRLVYVLSEEQRMSYREIADILDCPIGTVSFRKVQAVNGLRKLLEPLRDELLGEGFQPDQDRALSKTDQESNR